MELDYKFKNISSVKSKTQNIESLDNIGILSNFYEVTTGETLSGLQQEIIENTFKQIEGEK
ncbi:exonuclease [Lactococcus cremoris]|nr:exonuclease [Lactococcus cremoris]